MARRRLKPFISSIEMKDRAGEELRKAIRDQIRNDSDAYVLLSTRGACYSPDVSREILHAQRCGILIIPYRVNRHPVHQLIPEKFYLEFDKDNPNYREYAIHIKKSVKHWKDNIAQTRRPKKVKQRR